MVEMAVEPRGDQPVGNGAEPFRALGVLRAHFVQQERRVSDIGGTQERVSNAVSYRGFLSRFPIVLSNRGRACCRVIDRGSMRANTQPADERSLPRARRT